MTNLEQISFDLLKERNDQLFELAKKLLEIVDNSSAHIERGFHCDLVEEAKVILGGDMQIDSNEEIRLHKIRIAALETSYDDLLKSRFTEEDQRDQWESFWNILYNEFGKDYCQEVGIVMQHFKLVRNTQFTQQQDGKK